MAMTPMEAWSIISANLMHLVRIRRCEGDPKGYVDAEAEAEVICFQALKQMQNRYDQKRLEMADLKKMSGEWVWVEAECIDNTKHSGWGYLPKNGSDDAVMLEEFSGFWEGSPIFTVSFDFKDYGKRWVAYLDRPMEVK